MQTLRLSHYRIGSRKSFACFAAARARWSTIVTYCSNYGATTVISTPAASMSSSPNCAASSPATLDSG